MELGISDKVALVCGGSRGIAYAAAEEFAREGCRIVICARGAEALLSAAARLGSTGSEVLAIEADLSTDDGIARVVEQTTARFGRVDILLCNTGGPTPGGAMDHGWSAWQKAGELLLRSVVGLTQAFVPGMRERGWGRVVTITSLAVKRPQVSLVLSNSMRAAVTGYMRTLADEVAGDGVTVNSVLPGYTATERLEVLASATSLRTGQTPDSVLAAWAADAPVGRLGNPAELAAVIVFLCSARAGFMTGQAVLVDGGAVKSLL